MLATDGTMDLAARDAIVELSGCPGFANRLDPASPALQGAVSDDLWQLLGLPVTGIPPAVERARDLELSLAGGDYDDAEWTLGTADDITVLYWGPFGATIGGGEVQGILGAVPDSVRKADLGAAEPALEQLQQSSPAGAYAFAAALSSADRETWRQAFKTAGADMAVRAAYDRYALCSAGWLRQGLDALYKEFQELKPPATATEVDWAFFLDLAVQLRITTDRLHLVLEGSSLASASSPAARRQILGAALANDMTSCDQRARRLARNVAFLADDASLHLSHAELDACGRFGCGVHASDFGLSDSRQLPRLDDILVQICAGAAPAPAAAPASGSSPAAAPASAPAGGRWP